jgi:hypothetical protein
MAFLGAQKTFLVPLFLVLLETPCVSESFGSKCWSCVFVNQALSWSPRSRLLPTPLRRWPPGLAISRADLLQSLSCFLTLLFPLCCVFGINLRGWTNSSPKTQFQELAKQHRCAVSASLNLVCVLFWSVVQPSVFFGKARISYFFSYIGVWILCLAALAHPEGQVAPLELSSLARYVQYIVDLYVITHGLDAKATERLKVQTLGLTKSKHMRWSS